MNKLFILNLPEKLAECISVMSDADAIILIENAVICTSKKKLDLQNCYVLEEDLVARGLASSVNDDWKSVNYSEFVKLTLTYDKSVSWL